MDGGRCTWRNPLNIPEITEISRLVIQSGDRIVVRVDADLTDQQASWIKERIQDRLELPDGVRLIVVPRSMEFQVVAEEA
jgi:hypothetical protein